VRKLGCMCCYSALVRGKKESACECLFYVNVRIGGGTWVFFLI